MDNAYILEIKNLNVHYNPNIHSIKNVSLSVERGKTTALIGSKDCGKTSLLRSINRLHELYNNIEVTGEIYFDGNDLMKMNAIEVRKKIGMVFKNPYPFPNLNIFENVLAAYGINQIKLNKKEKEIKVNKYLTDVGLWDEVKDLLYERPGILTESQQQQLCIARAIAIEPEVLLMDESGFPLDPAATSKIENLMYQLKNKCTLIFATQNLSLAARISDFIIYMEQNEVIECGVTSELFWNPMDKRTENYINTQSYY